MKENQRITFLVASFLFLLLALNHQANAENHQLNFTGFWKVCIDPTPPGTIAQTDETKLFQAKEFTGGFAQFSGKVLEGFGHDCSSWGPATVLHPAGSFQTQSHLHTIQIVVKYLSATGKLLSTIPINLKVNSDGTIPRQKFGPIPGFTIKAKERINISIIPVEGFLAPQNILTLNVKFPV